MKLAPRMFALLVLCACARNRAPPPSTTSASRVAAIAHAAPPELTVESFQTFAQSHHGEVGACYEAALAADPEAIGGMTLAFSVLPDGAIADVEVVSSTFKGDAVPACVARAVAGWRTPFRPDEPVGIEVPLSFSPAR